MSRLDRLRWVPMLIRAYYDAQSRVGSQGNSGVTFTEVSEPQEMPQGTRPASVDVSKPGRSAPRMSQSRRGKKPRPLHRVPRKGTAGVWDKNAKLLRELRATNEKLQRLEQIQQELHQLGSVIDNFHQQITQLQSEAKTVQREKAPQATVLPPTDPASPPPYTF